MTISEDSIFVEKQTGLKAIQIKTSPYPGFATDLQQPITPLLLTAAGRGRIVDTIYEKRVNHVPELAKMGATISTLNDHIIYEGPNQLTGSSVKATDLRAGCGFSDRRSHGFWNNRNYKCGIHPSRVFRYYS